MSGAGPLLGTPVDGSVAEGETKEVVVSAQSMVYWVPTSSTTKDAYLLEETERGEDTGVVGYKHIVVVCLLIT